MLKSIKTNNQINKFKMIIIGVNILEQVKKLRKMDKRQFKITKMENGYRIKS